MKHSYVHTIVGTGHAFVERDGQIVHIVKGDPEYDALAERYRKHLEDTLRPTYQPDAPL